jgi:hypothetical protein
MTLTRYFLITLLASFSVGALADLLLIQQVRQAGAMDVPDNGLNMSEVEAAYGTPETKGGAVGTPPITRWTYERWSVYFEYDRVLYTVLHEGEVIDGVSRPEADTELESEAGFESEADSGEESESADDSG